MGLCTIKKSADFRRVRGGARYASGNFVIEARQRSAANGDALSVTTGSRCTGPRFGFTVTRKLGNAVVRNHIRRRFKEAIRTSNPALARAGHDYVVVPRAAVTEMAFDALKQEVEDALIRLHRKSAGSDRERPGRVGPARSR